MNWATNTGEAGAVSTLIDGSLTVDPTIDFTSITFDVTGGKAKFDNFSYTAPVLPADQTLQFSIYGVDGDGDQSGTQTLSVTMLGTKAANTPINGTSSDEAIKGTSSADTLNGSDGNDILEGGAANDTLSGGNGADLFVLDGHSTALNVGAGGTDIIQDFQSGLDQILVDVVNLSFPLSSAQPGQAANSTSAETSIQSPPPGAGVGPTDSITIRLPMICGTLKAELAPIG